MWREIAYAARYGGQPINLFLHREPTARERKIFVHFLEEIIKAENPKKD